MLCKLREDIDVNYGISMARYSEDYIASLGEEEAAAMAKVVSERKKLIDASCVYIEKADFEKIDEALYRSAALGDPASMRLFALQGDKVNMFGEKQQMSRERADLHQKFAEQMLNGAADAGDPAAIKAIYSVYASGKIHTPAGDIEVRRDLVKSAAAYLALVSVNDFNLQATSQPQDFENAEKMIDIVLSRFGEADQIRLAKLESQYVIAYRKKNRPKTISEALVESFPEQGCSARMGSAGM